MTPIPRKSPQLLIRPIDDTHYYAVNCACPHSLRILNRGQHALLSAIDNCTSVTELARTTSLPVEGVKEFLELLAQTEIIRYDDGFSIPQRPDTPQSLNFWIHTTNRCNLTCGYCYISTLNATGGMDAETRQQLLHKMEQSVHKRGIKQIKLRLAGGEPLSQFRVWQAFIPQAKEALGVLGCQLDVAFITNLTILSDEIIDFSKEQGISYGVSLDGLGGDHDATRTFRSGAGSFERVDRNLRSLLTQGISLSTTTVITDANIAGLPALTRYLIELDAPFRYSIVKGQAIDANQLDEYLSTSYAIMEEAIERGWRFASRHQFCDLKPNELGFQTCASGFSGGAIYVDGTVNYCHVHFGDATKTTFSIFDDSLDLVDMIEQGSHEENDRSTDCRSCRYKAVCTSGCPVYRVDGKDPQCSLYHKFIPLIYDLQAKERLKLLHDYQMI